ncbi:hypothetical protein COY07_04710 [Candidatus Peregrinibacteria bacterium CG_4_10_14_0_2_um_filter_43_11]|nr:MAG: hypothetical protein COY07_04710 [Candidatus Peregrinibacteria bacterium CG_4_10_14_0_2_um_filter_43_11]
MLHGIWMPDHSAAERPIDLGIFRISAHHVSIAEENVRAAITKLGGNGEHPCMQSHVYDTIGILAETITSDFIRYIETQRGIIQGALVVMQASRQIGSPDCIGLMRRLQKQLVHVIPLLIIREGVSHTQRLGYGSQFGETGYVDVSEGDNKLTAEASGLGLPHEVIPDEEFPERFRTLLPELFVNRKKYPFMRFGNPDEATVNP